MDFYNTRCVAWSPDRCVRQRQHPETAARTKHSSTRLVLQVPKRSMAQPLLEQLYWLPVRQRIDYKLAVVTYKIRCTSTPSYTSPVTSDLWNLLVISALLLHRYCTSRPPESTLLIVLSVAHRGVDPAPQYFANGAMHRSGSSNN